MNFEYENLKKMIKIRISFAFILLFLFVGAGIALTFIFDQLWILFVGLALGLGCYALILIPCKGKITNSKAKIATRAVRDINEEYTFSYFKSHDIKDLEEADVSYLSSYFIISATLEFENEIGKITSYSTNFKGIKNKSVVGRLIKIEYKDYIKFEYNDISSIFLKKADYHKKIMIKDETLYIYVASYQFNKDARIVSFDPLDFSTYEDYKNRIRKEFELYDKLLELNK